MHRSLKPIIMRTDDNDKFLKYMLETPYGRCVYHCDNDAVDHQAVIMEYEGGVTVSWQASAFTMETIRQIKVMGTKGEIEGCIDDDEFEIGDFASGNITEVHVHTPKTLHSGGDECIMETFTKALRNPQERNPMYDAGLSLQGHVMAFAAEESRSNGGKVIEL